MHNPEMTVEQMITMMFQKQQTTNVMTLRMVESQQAIEKKLKQQKKELEKEQEGRRQEEEWMEKMAILEETETDEQPAQKAGRARQQATRTRLEERVKAAEE